MLRIDSAVARASLLFASSKGIKHESGRPLEVADFMPWPRHEEPEANPENVAALLRSISKRKT